MAPTTSTSGHAETRLSATRRAYRRALIGSTALVGITVGVTGWSSGARAQAFDWNGADANYNTPGNWTDPTASGTAPPDAAGETGTFSGNGNAAVTITGTVAPDSLAISGTQSYTISGGTVTFSNAAGLTNTSSVNQTVASVLGQAAGVTATVTQNGAGTLTLTGANTYSGTTNILGGTLSANTSSALGDGSATNTLIFNGGTLQAAGTITSPAARGVTLTGAGTVDTNGQAVSIAGIITGAGALTKAGTGTLTLTGTNTNTGTVTIAGGTLNANASAALGDGSATNTLIFNGGTLQAAGTITSPAARGVTLTGAGTVDTNGQAVSIAGIITGAGALTKAGTGTLTLTGTNTNTGTVTIAGGTLNANASAALGDGSATNTLIFNGGTLQAAGTITSPAARGVTLTGAGTVDTNGQAVSIAGVITGAGALTKAGTGTLTLTGTNTNTGTVTIAGGTLNANASAALGDGSATNTLIFNGGTLQAGGAITSPAARGVTLTGAGTVDTNGNAVLIAGVITGAGALTKAGANTLTLSGANTYTGLTTVGAGTLSVTNAAGLGTNAAGTTITAGATLNINGAAVGTEAVTLDGAGVGGAGGLTGTGTASLAGAITLGATTPTVGAATGTDTLTLSGVIADGAGTTLAKVGAGTVILTGANTYTGLTTVGAGTLSVTNAAGLGTNAAGTTITAGATLNINGAAVGTEAVTLDGAGVGGAGGLTGTGTASLAGAITLGATTPTVGAATGTDTLTLSGVIADGAGTTLAKVGAGTVILTGANSYSGNTTVTAGTLQIGNAGTTGQIGQNAGGTTFSNVAVSAGANLTFNRSNTYVYGGVISGAGAVNQSGTAGSITVLTGANTYTGATSVTAGTLQIGNAGTTGQIGFDGATYSPVAVSTGANLTVNRTNAYAYGGAISGAGAFTQAGTGTTTLTGINTYTGATSITAGTLQIGDGTAGGDGGQLGFDGTTYTNVTTTGGTLAFDRTNGYTYGGLILGAGTVNQIGTGVTTLTGTNTAGNAFSGAVNVTAGTLAINGTLGNPGTNTATLTVGTAGTLHGSGTFAGSVTVNAGGTVSAGNSPGTLTVAGNYTVNAGSTNLFELGNSGVVGGANNDLIAVGGNLAINGGTLQLRAADGSNTLTTGAYRLYNYAGTGTFAGPNAGFTTVSSAAATATVYTTIPNQVNVLLQNGNQLAQYWDGADQAGNGTIDGGTGTWNAANTNWTTTPGAQINNSWQSQVGIFSANPGTVAVVGAQNVQGLQFTATGYLLNGAGSINLTGDPFTTPAQSFLNIDSGVTATINTAITGNAGIGMRKIGGGTLQLGGPSTYPGATTVDAGTLTVISGGSIIGTSSLTNNATFNLNAGGTVTTPTVTNNATFSTGGTLNATASVTNAAGATFNLTGGTVTTPAFTNNATLNSSGGAIAAPTFTNTAIVNGTLQLTNNTTATNTAAGTINNGLNISAAASGSTFANAGIAGTGGLVVGNTGGTLVANNNGTFFGTAASVAGSTSTFNNNGTWNYQSAATLSGTDIINNPGLFRVTAAGGGLDGLDVFNNTGSGRVELNGTLGGTIGIFNNNANGNNGGVYLQGRSIGTVTTFNNNAFLSSVTSAGGANSAIGAATFNNGAAGTISLVNGLTTDRLTLGGNYNGTAGSRIAVDVNLSQVAGMRSDVVAITGANNGSTTLVLNRLDNRGVFFSTPIQVITASSGASNVQLSQPIQGNGFVTYELVQNSPGSYQIASRLNVSSAAGAAGSITSLITALNVGFFQSVSAFIGAPSANTSDQTASTSAGNSEMTWAQLNDKSSQNTQVAATPGIRPNTISGGVWARGSGGQFAISANNTATFPGATTVARTKVETTFGGFQFGGDTGLFNIDNTGWNVHLGVTGGEAMATGTQKFGSVTTGNFTVPFVGLYTAFTNGPFFSDLSYRHDFYDAKITDALAGVSQQRISLQSNTVAASVGYRFDFENLFGTENPYFIEPSGSISFTHTNVGNFAVNGGNLRFSDIDSILPRAGVRVGTALMASDRVALQPFVTLSVLHEFGESVRTRFEANTLATDPNAFVPILTQRVGTFGQVGVGAAAQILDTPILGYVRGDVRFGDRIDGYALNAGVRYQF